MDGICHSTYEEAAQSLGLFRNFQESELAIQEAIANWYSPHHVRFLFGQLLIDVPTPAKQIWERYGAAMSADFGHLKTHWERNTSALMDLAKILQARGASLTQFGLPTPNDRPTEVEWEMQQMMKECATNKQQFQTAATSFNDEQRRLFETLKKSLLEKESKAYFVDGRAGRGKSFVLQAFVEYCRWQRILVLVVGSTALSVVQYVRGRTAHSAFSIPVNSVSYQLQM